MTHLTAEDFAGFFRSLWGKEPFAWQRELARRVFEDEAPWPEAIALPTAAGKTACMDIAVFALAAQAGRLVSGLSFTAPRRIFFVVDRRVIVDEAFERARTLADRLRNARAGIVKDIADRLRQLSDSELPLAAYQLRGGTRRSEAWATTPVQPLIAACTVDQIGSRLLFRGYGPGQGMWPVHAGLVGNDSLILLDEAHCAQPFMETLKAVGRYRKWAENLLTPPFLVSVLSATPPMDVTDVFRDESGEGRDGNHPLGRRQLVGKPARLCVAEKAKGKNMEAIREELAGKLAKEAEILVKSWVSTDSAPAVVVFCNRVDTARKVHKSLEKAGADSGLFTGRMRPIDKEEVGEALAELSVDNAESRRLTQPRFVVATQTLEVGANLDFDLLVTECASMDALRQRFGRLNRLGRAIPTRAVIVVRADQAEDSTDDPVYGEALANTWAKLNEWAEVDVVDFGIANLAPKLPALEELANLNAPAQHAPVLLPAHVDALAQTDPEPWPSPEVALFLHGPKTGPADVQVCWRADLSGNETNDLEILALCPPASPECLTVPFAQMRRWLTGQKGGAGADVEGTMESDEDETVTGEGRWVIRWRGRESSETLRTATSLRPGDLVVIPASLGGWEELATLGAHPVLDWGDLAHARMRGKAQLRLHPEVVKQWPDSTARDRLIQLAENGPARMEDDAGSLADELQAALEDWSGNLEGSGWKWLKTIAAHLASDSKLARHITTHPNGGLVLAGSRPLPERLPDRARFSDEDDSASSGHFRSLLVDSTETEKSHLEGVAGYAARQIRLCGLPKAFDALGKILETAGRVHDLGKADPRFQAWLKGGNPWARGPLLAKSPQMAQSRTESRKARERAGYPRGGRHELLSVRLLESVPGALPQDQVLRDLLLHLVESHHGHCRPFAPFVEDPNPKQVDVEFEGRTYTASSATGLERLDSGPAERYWRLTRHYGWWGLAWLEALLRLSDHRRSEWEEMRMKEAE